MLLPHFLFERNEGGVSNFGVHARTVLPYTLGFGGSGLLLIRAAVSLPKHAAHYKTMRRLLAILSSLLLLVLVTTYPYKLNRLLDDLHIFVAQLFFVFELIMSLWLALKLSRNVGNNALLLLQITGSGLALITLFGFLHVLFIAQIIAGLAFAGLLLRATFLEFR